ncbi:MAG: UDP-N-acetylmuramoyl-L-alanyl-D-glutamate--2,6-diaminopimelate ligase [Nitrospirota bacterium]
MMLKELLKDCPYVSTTAEEHGNTLWQRDIKGIAYDSRRLEEGFLFVAVEGEKTDGHRFIHDAIEKGAAAVVHEKETAKPETHHPELKETSGIPFIRVKNSRKTLACIANNFYERPSENMTLVGITGTNGKTTTSYLLRSILEDWGKTVGLIGTIQYMIKDRIFPAAHTTPESLEFQSLLKDMLVAGCDCVVAEVSSHALAQYRVDDAVFRTAVFTNLTRDHLDYHKTMENYFSAKERLFTGLLDREGTAVINLDDRYGWSLNMDLRVGGAEPRKIITYGLETQADLRAQNVVGSFDGLRVTLDWRGKNYGVSSPLTGKPNVYNILAAAGAAVSLGVPWDNIVSGIEKLSHIRGRFEKVDKGQGFLCIIDYAHTEDALERLIRTARELLDQQSTAGSNKSTGGRIITVFGCGGDRDRGKRPNMGRIAAELSDFVIITSDNPRSEEPEAIIRDIEAGAKRGSYIIEADRREAITKAVLMARDGDIVLVAGKGHEDYQEIKGVRRHFSDREIVEETLKDLRRR